MTPVIYTRPEPAVQRPVAANSKDRKGYKRYPLGRQIIREKGKR